MALLLADPNDRLETASQATITATAPFECIAEARGSRRSIDPGWTKVGVHDSGPPIPSVKRHFEDRYFGSRSDLYWYQMLNEQLRNARRSAGWSQRTLADRIGVDAQVVKRLERGVGSVSTLIAAMEALDFRLTGLGPGATLPDQLRARRLRRALSLAKVAARAGLARGTVASLECGGGSVASLLRLLTVLAPTLRRRAPERSYWGEGDKLDRDSRFTPPDFMAAIYAGFGEIDLDPCGHSLSPVAARRRILQSEGGDGLVEEWRGRLVYVNPPFSALLVWLRRAYQQWKAGNVETVVCLVPVRTDSAWFHDVLMPSADLYFLKGRVRFLDPRGRVQQTPFSLMLVALGATSSQKTRYSGLVPGFWLGGESPRLREKAA